MGSSFLKSAAKSSRCHFVSYGAEHLDALQKAYKRKQRTKDWTCGSTWHAGEPVVIYLGKPHGGIAAVAEIATEPRSPKLAKKDRRAVFTCSLRIQAFWEKPIPLASLCHSAELKKWFAGHPYQSKRTLVPSVAVELLSLLSGNRTGVTEKDVVPPTYLPAKRQNFSAEGERKLVTHLRAERSQVNRKLILSTRKKPYRCEACHVDLSHRYGARFTGCIEVHHRIPVGAGKRIPQAKDFALLCPNCHLAVHYQRSTQPLPVEKLRQQLAREKNRRMGLISRR